MSDLKVRPPEDKAKKRNPAELQSTDLSLCYQIQERTTSPTGDAEGGAYKSKPNGARLGPSRLGGKNAAATKAEPV